MSIDPVPLPIQEAIRDFFTDLLGRGVAASKRPARVLDDALLVGRFDGDDGVPAAVFIADVAFAAISGAALAMIPPIVAEEAADQGELSVALLDNFREVVNVFSGVLNTPSTPHLTLRNIGRHPEETAELASLLEAPSRRRDFDVTVEGYGSGYCAILVC
jgi:hypothetical protein